MLSDQPKACGWQEDHGKSYSNKTSHNKLTEALLIQRADTEDGELKGHVTAPGAEPA